MEHNGRHHPEGGLFVHAKEEHCDDEVHALAVPKHRVAKRVAD